MRNLLEVLKAQESDEVVLARDFMAFVLPRNGEGIMIVNVQAVLERTAVVYEPGRVDEKRVVRLDRIEVSENQIKWVPRNPRELQAMRARQIGRNRGRLKEGKVA